MRRPADRRTGSTPGWRMAAAGGGAGAATTAGGAAGSGRSCRTLARIPASKWSHGEPTASGVRQSSPTRAWRSVSLKSSNQTAPFSMSLEITGSTTSSNISVRNWLAAVANCLLRSPDQQRKIFIALSPTLLTADTLELNAGPPRRRSHVQSVGPTEQSTSRRPVTSIVRRPRHRNPLERNARGSSRGFWGTD